MIKAEIVAHSLNPQGDELISVLCTFPRIILAEVNTHRMLSKNTSSSRAIPFKKMVEAIQNNPFIPIAWQKEHKGMQGTEYLDFSYLKEYSLQPDVEEAWLRARDNAVNIAIELNDNGNKVTKQLCNRLLEPFMWTTMLITGSREGWNNFFHLRCPHYIDASGNIHRSRKDYCKNFVDENWRTDLQWLQINQGQAEIHIMTLAECIYDAVNESTPKQLKSGEWHIPFEDKIKNMLEYDDFNSFHTYDEIQKTHIEISTAMAARTSYTVVGKEKEINYEKMISLHDKLISQDPPHSSPLEHCARVMNDIEHKSFYKGNRESFGSSPEKELQKENNEGWCNNFKGFIQYRYLIDNKLEV